MCDGYESDTAQVGQLVAEKAAGVVFDLVELADRQVGAEMTAASTVSR